MRDHYIKELEDLNREIIEMGEFCEAIIEKCALYIEKKDEALRKDVIRLEKATDQKERIIERHCLALLLQQQPVASDLRLVSAALKLISDLERIGDQAYDIVDILQDIELTALEVDKTIVEVLHRMAREAIVIVNQSVDAFVKRDLDLAYKTMVQDETMDEIFHSIKLHLVDSIRSGEARHNSEAYMDALLIAKYLERIGDHAVNVAEWVIFSLTAEHPFEESSP